MSSFLSSLVVMLAIAQPSLPVELHLRRGQEFVYRGMVEEAWDSQVNCIRRYQVQVHLFVLDRTAQRTALAIMTTLGQPLQPAVQSVRLEQFAIDASGSVEPPMSAPLDLEGPATVETGMIVAKPRTQSGLPMIVWQMQGNEVAAGATCMKLIGKQESTDWNAPRADSAAWLRTETVWLSLQTGVAQRVERHIEWRDPARPRSARHSRTCYELESLLLYPGQLYEDRRREIAQAGALAEATFTLRAEPPSHDAGRFQTLLARTAYHLENQPPTPYRAAIVQQRRSVEAALQGVVVPSVAPR